MDKHEGYIKVITNQVLQFYITLQCEPKIQRNDFVPFCRYIELPITHTCEFFHLSHDWWILIRETIWWAFTQNSYGQSTKQFTQYQKKRRDMARAVVGYCFLKQHVYIIDFVNQIYINWAILDFHIFTKHCVMKAFWIYLAWLISILKKATTMSFVIRIRSYISFTSMKQSDWICGIQMAL